MWNFDKGLILRGNEKVEKDIIRDKESIIFPFVGSYSYNLSPLPILSKIESLSSPVTVISHGDLVFKSLSYGAKDCHYQK